MGIINVLDKQTANLIAAGEVVERPSSAIKEMLENCADAGATSVTVEIKNGGTTFIRVTDNGCGIQREDVPKCILRHATSKIKTGADLEAIGTFGFRGEALAAIAAVSKVRILTKNDNEETGTLFESHFGDIIETNDAGCPKGTTITVENIFENVPARRKFLKKDSTEALSVAAVCEKFALSRCEIALTLISNNEIKLQTPGDGNLKSAIYACMGREFASYLFPVDYEFHGVRIHGFIAKPEFSRPNRNMQNFFVNNRYIRSRTMMAAIEEGFRGFCPTGKFPACVLFCDIDLRLVDVNVHPAKLEIKFSDEKRVFDSIYFAVKNALSSAVTFAGFTNDEEVFPKIENKDDSLPISEPPKNEVKKEPYKAPPTPPLYSSPISEKTTASSYTGIPKQGLSKPKEMTTLDFLKDVYTPSASPVKEEKKTEIKIPELGENTEQTPKQEVVQQTIPVQVLKQEEIVPDKKLQKPIYIGEAFNTYIVAQNGQSLYLIDKHAAHERIIYEKLKKPDHENSAQYLLEPIHVILTPKEAEAAIQNKEYFEKIGFDFDDFGQNTMIIRSIPTPIFQSDTKDVFTFLAGKLSEGNQRSAGEIFDRALFTAACRAAIKAGDRHTDFDNKYILDEIFNNEAVLYCPHGRPVIYEFTKSKLDKMFDRL
ncbi:MAG: DNA mismatch repair endonuclease MutL [Clostridia bacterium]|nr:DNA mismatch repair endonuclease MutL [Clostridia bacterium]